MKQFLQAGFVVHLGLLCACGAIGWSYEPDEGFWCEGVPCGWRLDEGEVERVATWNERDEGVGLKGRPAQLSRREEGYGGCYGVRLVADVPEDTRTELRVDVNDDGTVDATYPIEGEGWQQVEIDVPMPKVHEDVRFVLRKSGNGIARMGLLRIVEQNPAVCDDKAIELQPQNAGAACAEDDRCGEGVCAAGHCSECAEEGSCDRGDGCDEDRHCAEGLGCGGQTCSACAAGGDCSIGAGCNEDADCESGICAVGLCSVCASDDDCRSDEHCQLSVADRISPRVCREQEPPPAGIGELCVDDAQCADGVPCESDDPVLPPRCGRACTEDAGCPDGTICSKLFEDFLDGDGVWGVCVNPEDCDGLFCVSP